MNKTQLIHPKLTANVTAHFPNRATILDATVTYDEANQPQTTYADTANPLLTNIRCYIEPISGATSGEVRREGYSLVTDQWNCVLAGDYPQIDNTQGIRVDDVEYNIVNVSTEATRTITALVLEKVSL